MENKKAFFNHFNINVSDIEKSAGFYGRALGLKKVVIKTHGSSKAKAVRAAVHQAINAVRNNIVGAMEERLQSVDWEKLSDESDGN